MNAVAHYLHLGDSTSGPNSVPDFELFTQYLLGLGPDVPQYALGPTQSLYTVYPPAIDVKNNFDVGNLLDFGGPGCNNVASCEGTAFGGYFNKAVQGTNGSLVTVQIPAQTRPDGSVHLFPYVKALSLQNGSNGVSATFSDQVTTPSFGFPVNGEDTVVGSPVANNKNYSVSLMPEVEIIDQGTYGSYVAANTAKNVPKAILTIQNAFSGINGIPMVGNPLASLTKNNKSHGLPYFLYDQYFWDYNGRASSGNGDMHTFQANVPYKLHPYVASTGAQGNQLTINFSRPIHGSGSSSDATAYVAVNASACMPAGQGAFDNGQGPTFSSPTACKEGYNSITMTLNPNIHINQDSSSCSSNAVKITVKNVASYPNNFPLLGNTHSSSYCMPNPNNSATSPAFERNSDKFPQTSGDFTMIIPCSGGAGSCTPSCQGKQDGDSDGCGGVCCVPNLSSANNSVCTTGDSSPKSCGGTYSCLGWCDCDCKGKSSACIDYCGGRTGSWYFWSYSPSPRCMYAYDACNGEDAYGLPNVVSSPGCSSPILDCESQ